MSKTEYIDFEGMLIPPENVIAIGKIERRSIGPSHCDWEYGFEIFLNAGSISYHTGMSRFGYAGGPSLEEYKRKVSGKRDKLVALLQWEEKGKNE